VQARGLEEPGEPDRTVEAIAARNLDAIRGVQAHGPYAIGGHSFGGMVAFETACLLRAAGEEVDVVVMLDAGAPLGRRGITEHARRMRAQVRASGPLGIAYPAASSARAALAIPRTAYERTRARVVSTTAGRVSRQGLAQYEAFYELHVMAAKRYRPARTFDGHIVIFRVGASDDLGWSQLTTGAVTVVRVPGDHLSLLRPPAVREVGRQLTEILR
jgi:thioesterase domain-containing protein